MQLRTRVPAALVLCLLALGTVVTAQNQYVILYPGPNSPSTILQVYLPNSGGLLASASINTLPAGASQILPTPDGTKYYIISVNGNPLSTMDSNFQNIKQIGGSISLAPTVAALTPDGRRLVVLAGNNVYVVDTSSDLVLAPAGLPIQGKGTDIAMSIDSNKAYILSQGVVGASGTVVTAIDLAQTIPVVAGSPLTLNGDGTSPATGLTMSPSGFLYLSNQYRVFEINPITMRVTGNGEIQVQAYPGKPFITPDGKYLVCTNLRPVQGGTSMIQVDLTTKQTASFPSFGDTLDRFYSNGLDAAGNNLLYAVSSFGSLYDVKLSAAPNVTTSALNAQFSSGLAAPTFTGIQFSNETPPRLLWATNTVSSQNYLYQLDIRNQNSGQPFTQIPIPSTNLKLGTLSIAPSSGGVQLSLFNSNQTVAGGTQSVLPLVARLTDASGRGIYRGQITFTAVPSVTIQTPNFITGVGGYASTYITAPTAPGTYTVTANGGPGVQPLDFVITVPGSTGGGGGSSAAGLYYISGNGQVLLEQSQSQPMVVQVLDSNSKPVPNASVTYTLTTGVGSLAGNSQISVLTDANGLASLIFLASAVNAGNSFSQATIAVTASTGNAVNFVMTTVLSTLPSGGLAGPPTVQELVFTNGQRIINATAGDVVKGAYSVAIAATVGGQAGQPISGVGIRVTNNCNTVTDITSPTGTACADENPPPLGNAPTASCLGNPLSDASGVLTCDLQVGSKVGKGNLFFVVGEFNHRNAVTFVVTAGPPAKMTITSGNGQSGKPGDRLLVPLGVKATDLAGNIPSSPATITWTVILGNASFVVGNAVVATATTTTSANGIAQINVQLGGSPGPVKIQALINKNVFIVFDANVTVVVSKVSVVSGDNQTAFTNGVFVSPLVVSVVDQLGSPVANQTVSFSATNGATVNPLTSTTGADGTASTRVTAGSAIGTIFVTASAAGFQASFTNLTVKLPGPQILSSSFMNSASGLLGLTPCSLGVIQATGIAPGINGTIAPSGFGPNPTSLGPVQSLTIGGFAAPLTSVSNINGVEKVGFQVPCEVPAGTTTVSMNVSGGNTSVDGVVVVAYSPGMFESVASDGKPYAIALRPDGSFIGPSNPAARGETIRVFVTGLGQATPFIGTNRAGTGGQTVNAPIIGGVNNVGVLVVKAEYLAGQIGTYIVDLQIPSDTSQGSYQPIAVAVQPPDGGPLIFGNGVFIPIQ